MAAAVDGGDGKSPAAGDVGDGNNPALAHGDGKNPAAAFRWINAVRYTVALVVTVLIVSVIVIAIKFVTRSDTLHVSVVGGFVSTENLSPPPNGVLALELNVRAQNPSGRARMYYINISAYFFNNKTLASTSSNLDYDSMVYIKIPDIVVAQQRAVDSSISVNATNSSMPEYFDLLYNASGRMKDVTLRLDGNLTTEVMSGSNNTVVPTTYYCDNLLVGGDKDDEAFKGTADVTCTP